MTKRERVIKALGFCLMPPSREELENDICSHEDCPYYREYNGGKCVSAVAKDALALLKAHEPRAMTLEEWREWKRKPLSQRDPLYYVDNKGFGSWIAPNDQLFIYATPELGYGILFVCWTSRPDQATREAVKWE